MGCDNDDEKYKGSGKQQVIFKDLNFKSLRMYKDQTWGFRLWTVLIEGTMELNLNFKYLIKMRVLSKMRYNIYL